MEGRDPHASAGAPSFVRPRIQPRLGAALLGLALLAGCASARTSAGPPGDRTEEQVAQRGRPNETKGGSPSTSAGTETSPLADARAVHGTIDPATGRRTAQPAVDLRLREPRRVEIQAGRLRQAAEEYEAGTGELPYGFRVQVLANPDFSKAGAEASRLKQLMRGAAPVYVEFIDPYYKVRVGDFATQEEAQSTLAQVRDLGYSDAWIVRTTIKQTAS